MVVKQYSKYIYLNVFLLSVYFYFLLKKKKSSVIDKDSNLHS